MNTRVVPLPTNADARNRAWRTFLQGLALDVAAAVVMAVAPSLFGADFAWTRDYWTALGLLAAKTLLQAGVSYWMRHVVPPPDGDPEPATWSLRRPVDGS